MIYILRSTHKYFKVIKIGFSASDIEARMKKIQTGCPFTLELAAYKEGDIQEERRLHALLESWHIRGEWFDWNRRVMKILTANGFDLRMKLGIKVPVGTVSNLKRINGMFKHQDYPYNPKPWPLDEFCKKKGFTEDAVKRLESGRSTFFIIKSTGRDIYEKIGFEVNVENKDEEMEFILPRFVVDMRKIRSNQERISRAFSKATLSPSPNP